MNKDLLERIECLEKLIREANKVILLSVEEVNTYENSCNPGVSGYRCPVCKKLDIYWERNSPRCKSNCLRSIWLKEYKQKGFIHSEINEESDEYD